MPVTYNAEAHPPPPLVKSTIAEPGIGKLPSVASVAV